MPSQLITLFNMVLVLTLAVVIGSNVVRAQDTTVPEQQPDSDEVLLRKADEDLGDVWRKIPSTMRAERRLKELLRSYPDSPLRHQAEERLSTVDEILGEHYLNLGLFYLNIFEKGKKQGLKGAEIRLRQLVCEYPRFSKMNEVLLHLVRVYSVSADGKAAKQFLQQFILKHPRDRDYKEACEELKRL